MGKGSPIHTRYMKLIVLKKTGTKKKKEKKSMVRMSMSGNLKKKACALKKRGCDPYWSCVIIDLQK